jgi:hypothetical protein
LTVPAGEFVPVGSDTAGASVFECGLCGASFTHGEKVCGACPLNAGCDLVRCPNCGYQFPRTSRIAEWVRRAVRLVRRRKAE